MPCCGIGRKVPFCKVGIATIGSCQHQPYSAAGGWRCFDFTLTTSTCLLHGTLSLYLPATFGESNRAMSDAFFELSGTPRNYVGAVFKAPFLLPDFCPIHTRLSPVGVQMYVYHLVQGTKIQNNFVTTKFFKNFFMHTQSLYVHHPISIYIIRCKHTHN